MAEAARTEPDQELARGEVFAGRYTIEDLLGRGGMGAVYRARDISLGEPIALKVLLLGPEPSPLAFLRFRQEVKLARRVTHPNVARVYDIGECDGGLYLTMELVDGCTLRHLLNAERRLSARRAVQIARDLLAGLAAAHEAGVVHRDIKPSNVLIDHTGRVVLGDFGVARGLEEDMALTVGPLGTPHYMAPEQARGEPVDARTDLYAVGLLLFEMVTGERAFDKPALLAEGMRVRGVPSSLAALMLRCLAHDADARPRSAREVEKALAEISLTLADEEITRTQPVLQVDPSGPTLPAEKTMPLLPSLSPPIAPPPSAARVLAVLPFTYHGPSERDYLGEVITDELVDVLSRTRGMRVLGTGATSKYRDARDPRDLGRDLGVFAVVNGTVQSTGARVRITARLADAETGAQVWSDHHEGTLEDLFAFQEAIARRIAEELRLELTTIAHRGGAPAEAVELYLAARRKLRSPDYASFSAGAALFDRCIALAPCFKPALAGHAIACLRAWFFSAGNDATLDWEEAAKTSVARARAEAGDLAESHLAAAMGAVQYGDYPAALRALGRAISIAPTLAEAHEHIGMLECEVGQYDAGAAHLKLAMELDPELSNACTLLARHHALHGRDAMCDAILTAMEQRSAVTAAAASITRARLAAWRGDRVALARLATGGRFARLLTGRISEAYAQSVLGALDDRTVEERFAALTEDPPNRRRLTYASQLLTEIFAIRGDIARAAHHLKRAADLVLVDLEWLDLCPSLAPLRALPAFAEARQRAQDRAESIWTT